MSASSSASSNGYCSGQVQAALKYGCEANLDLADRICCHNKIWAEPAGFASTKGLYKNLRENTRVASRTVFYDSVCNIPLFVAPRGRTFEAFVEESQKHGWPSFRKEEAIASNIILHPGGRMTSICGTHLGHNLPDGEGPRYCIDLVCIAGEGSGETVAGNISHFNETFAFVNALINDEPVPCSGEDGLIALVMAIAAGISAEEGRWVRFDEVPVKNIKCDESGLHCEIIADSDDGTVTAGDWAQTAMNVLKKNE